MFSTEWHVFFLLLLIYHLRRWLREKYYFLCVHLLYGCNIPDKQVKRNRLHSTMCLTHLIGSSCQKRNELCSVCVCVSVLQILDAHKHTQYYTSLCVWHLGILQMDLFPPPLSLSTCLHVIILIGSPLFHTHRFLPPVHLPPLDHCDAILDFCQK